MILISICRENALKKDLPSEVKAQEKSQTDKGAAKDGRDGSGRIASVLGFFLRQLIRLREPNHDSRSTFRKTTLGFDLVPGEILPGIFGLGRCRWGKGLKR